MFPPGINHGDLVHIRYVAYHAKQKITASRDGDTAVCGQHVKTQVRAYKLFFRLANTPDTLG